MPSVDVRLGGRRRGLPRSTGDRPFRRSRASSTEPFSRPRLAGLARPARVRASAHAPGGCRRPRSSGDRRHPLWLSFRGGAMFVYPLVGVLATALGVYGLLVRPVLVVRACRRVRYRIDQRGVEVLWSPERRILIPPDRVPPFSVLPAGRSPAAGDKTVAGDRARRSTRPRRATLRTTRRPIRRVITRPRPSPTCSSPVRPLGSARGARGASSTIRGAWSVSCVPTRPSPRSSSSGRRA